MFSLYLNYFKLSEVSTMARNRCKKILALYFWCAKTLSNFVMGITTFFRVDRDNENGLLFVTDDCNFVLEQTKELLLAYSRVNSKLFYLCYTLMCTVLLD